MVCSMETMVFFITRNSKHSLFGCIYISPLQEVPNGQDLTVDLYEGEVMAVGKEADRLEEVFAALKAQVNVRASRKKKDGDS